MTSDEQSQAGGGGPGADPFGFGGFWGAGGRGGRGNTPPDFEDMFENFGDFFNMGGRGMEKGEDILLSISISFQDAVKGTRKELAFEKRGTCKRCNGTRGEPGTTTSKCGTCGGKGTMNYRQGPMVFQMNCNKCKGVGTFIKDPCKSCHGNGIATTKIKEEINIPKGINNGQSLRMAGKVY